MNAAKIVDAINNGALDAYSTNPAIRSLISYANSALSDFTKATGTDLSMKTAITKLTPVLSIAVIDDASIVSIDNKLFVAGKRGSLAPVTDLSQYNLKGDIQMLLTVLSSMETTAEPNVLVLKSDFQKIAADNFMIKSFGIDLLATSDKFIIINDNAMSFDKADALLAANKSEIIASMLFNESATNVMKLIRSIMSTMDMYRGALLTNLYAKTVVADEVRIHVIKFGAGYSVVVMKGDVVIATSAYDDIMQVLADDYIVSNVEASNAFSNAFAADIEKATSKLSVKMKLVNDLIEERARYEALLEKINEEAKSLETIDANPEKVAALDELKGKVEEKLSIVVDEIAKLA
jgi:IMP dehydrogenase/GMP reductase